MSKNSSLTTSYADYLTQEGVVMFNREALLEVIWSEKRGKIVRPDIYPLGININLDDRGFHWHDLAYQILSCLRTDPARAYDWARNWGRCLVLVHPKRGFSVVFNTRMSDDELLGRFVMTSQSIDPGDYLNTHYNIGAYRAILNKSCQVKLEGAIIQIERMIDEVIWCEYLCCIEKIHDDIKAYAMALEHVWSQGLHFEYVTEDEILNRRVQDERWAVRVYGDILGHQTVPRIIGAVDPDKTRPMSNQAHRARLTSMSEIRSMTSQTLTTLPELGICVPFIGITLAKPIHFGHVLTIVFADLIRKVTNSSQSVYLESNDTGRRIHGLIARLSKSRKTSVDQVLQDLQFNHITPEEITTAYRERFDNGELMQQAKKLASSVERPILAVMENITLQNLSRIGIDTMEVVSERACQPQYQQLIAASQKIGEGFRLVRFNRGEHQRIVIVEREGTPTAAASRAVSVRKVIDALGGGYLPVYVDQDPSIDEAADLLNMVFQQPMVQLEGCGIGYQMTISSGSEGNIPTVDDLQCRTPVRNILSILRYYLLNRDSTATAQIAYGQELAFARTEPTGASWFDYKDEESLWLDWGMVGEEFHAFCRQIEVVKEVLVGNIKNRQESDHSTLSKTRRLIGKANLALEQTSLRQLFPPPLVLKLDPLYSRIRQWCFQQGTQFSKIDDVIVSACMEPDARLEKIAEKLSEIIHSTKRLPWPLDAPLECVFVKSAQMRGYVGPEAEHIARLYIDGQFCLIRKRCLHFDILRESVSLTSQLANLDESMSRKLLACIEFCQQRLGFA